MAKASVRQELPAPPPPKTIVLELSEVEARALRTLFMYVGGDPDTTQRKHISAIGYALTSVGVFPSHDRDADGSTYFVK